MEQTPAPKVSVLMAVKDGEKYLREAMDSILLQTFSDFEFIIVDDDSRDGTSSILEEYSDPRIILLKNESSIGLTKSLNLMLGKAKGEYIARMDADDISLSERLTAQVLFLGDHPEIGVLGTAASLIDSQGVIGDLIQYPQRHTLLYWTMCFFVNPIIHPSVMFRRKLIVEMGGYDEGFVTSQDFDLWSRMVIITNLANIPDVYLYLRKHEENISHSHYRQQQQDSLKISTSLVSSILNSRIHSVQLNGYCDLLWNHTKMTAAEISFAARIIFRLAKIFPARLKMIDLDKRWIVENAINRLNSFSQEMDLPVVEKVKLDYWIWSLKHLP